MFQKRKGTRRRRKQQQMALSSTAIPHSNFGLADASCYPLQMKLLKGQSRRLQSHLLIHVGRHPNYSTPSVKLPTKAQFCEPSKVKLHVNFIREKMWIMTPDPIKEFPWKKAKDVVLKRALETGQQALKWSLVALLIFGTISDIIFSISKNKEFFVPFGLFVGCIMATFLKETSQELFPNLEETGMAWNLMGLSCFFVVVKSLATYFTLGRQIFLLHAANGGLMQILWLSRTSQEDNERGQKQPLVDDVSTTMGVEKLCKQLDGRHRKDEQGTPEGGYKMDSTAADALDGIGKVVQPPTDDVSTALGVVDSTTAEALDGAGKDVQGTPEGGYTMESTAAKALDGAEKVNDNTSDQKVANDDKILTRSINSRAETMKDPLADTVDGYTMDSMAAEALDGAEKVNDIAFDQRIANENKILIESTCSRAERMEDPLTDTVDGFTMDSTAAEDLDGAEEVNDATFDQKVANDDKILLIGGITDSRAAERMNDPLVDTVEKRCLINSGYAINPMAAEALDAAEKVNDTTKSMNNPLIADSVDGYTVDSTASEALDGAVKGVQPLADEVSTAMGVEKLCKQQDGKHEKAVQGTPEGEYPMDFTDAEALDGAPLADYVSTATGVEKLYMQSDGEQEKDVQRTPEGSMYTMDSMATEALDGAEKVSDIIFDQSVASDNKILIKSNNSSAERMKDPLTHTADGYRMVSTAAEARVEGCTVRKENLDLATVEALESSSKLEKDSRYVMDSTAAEALDGAGKVSDTTFDQNVANDNKILVGSTADSGAERMNDLLADTVEVLCTDAENALDWAMDSIDAEAFDGEGKVNDNSFDQNVENNNKFLVRSTDGRAERINDPVADTVEQVDGLSITWRKKKKNVRAGVDIHGVKALDPPDHPLKSHPELLKEELSSLTVSQRKRPRKARVERGGTVGKGNLDVTMKALESSQLELKKEPVGGLSIPQRRKKEVRAGECTHGEKKVLNPPDHELHPELPKDLISSGYAMDSMTAEALDGAGKVNGTTKSMNDPLANSVEQVGDLPITQRKKKKQIRSGQGTHREKAAVDPPDHALDSHPELSNEEVANLTISKRKMPKKARIEGGTVGKQNLDLTAEALDSPSKLKREIAHTDAETTLTRRRGRRKNVEKLDGEQKKLVHRTNLKGPANGSSVSTRRKKVRAGESTHGGKAFDPQDHG